MVQNQFYHLQKNQWLECTKPEQSNCKIGLFSICDQAKQVNQLKKWLETNPSLVVRFAERNNAIIWEVFGDSESIIAAREELNKTDFDYLVWPEGSVDAPRLMLFDMDSTFIQIEVIDELAKAHGVGEQVAEVTESAMRGELDFAESLISRVECLKGLSQSAIEEIAEKLPLSEGVEQLVARAKQNGCETAIVSGGFTPFVGKLKTDMELFEVHANTLEIESNRLTGRVIGDIVDAEAKAEFLKLLCNQLSINERQVMAIGDGANDLKMMNVAGYNVAYRAKPMVQSQARGRLNSLPLNRLADLFDW